MEPNSEGTSCNLVAMVTARNLMNWHEYVLKGGGFCQNWCAATHFYTFGPDLRTIDQRGKVYIFGKIASLEVQKFQNLEPYELQEKSYCRRSPEFDVTYQPQLEMLLLLYLWKELLQR